MGSCVLKAHSSRGGEKAFLQGQGPSQPRVHRRGVPSPPQTHVAHCKLLPGPQANPSARRPLSSARCTGHPGRSKRRRPGQAPSLRVRGSPSVCHTLQGFPPGAQYVGESKSQCLEHPSPVPGATRASLCPTWPHPQLPCWTSPPAASPTLAVADARTAAERTSRPVTELPKPPCCDGKAGDEGGGCLSRFPLLVQGQLPTPPPPLEVRGRH